MKGNCHRRVLYVVGSEALLIQIQGFNVSKHPDNVASQVIVKGVKGRRTMSTEIGHQFCETPC